VHEVLGDEGARRKEMNTTIRGHKPRVTLVIALLTVLLLLAVALVFALQPAPTTSDRDASPANHAMSAGGNGGSSLAQDPIHRHVKVVERLGNGILR
jgi:Trk-type K+ transport system membrane component